MRTLGKKWMRGAVCLLCGLLFTTGCGKSVKIKAYIDGADTLKIRRNKIWFEHEEFELPGDHNSKPTLINNKPWRPQWHDNVSSSYESLTPAFNPHSADSVRLTKLSGRGEVAITELPTIQNDETLAIHFKDEPLGADWYEVTIEWK